MKHERQFNVRVTQEEFDLLDKFYITIMARRCRLITRSAFFREALLMLAKVDFSSIVEKSIKDK